MKRIIAVMLCLLLLAGCGAQEKPPVESNATTQAPTEPTIPTEPPPKPGIMVPKVEGLRDDFAMGADVSSLIAQENSGVVYCDFDGQPQDLLKTLGQSGLNYIRVRIWNDPYDSSGNGYGGGNCDLQNAIAIGKRAAAQGMKLLVDFHYSDFWADPGKQQAPKAWQGLSFEEKAEAMADFTRTSLEALRENGVDVGMVQIGNETNGGFCGEWTAAGQYKLMARAADAVRSFDPAIQIAVHYTNPEKGGFRTFAGYLKQYGVDYDIFATSYYPYWHGTLENLTAQLSAVADGYGKKVMVAETSWIYTAQDSDGHHNSVSTAEGYPVSVQGQADALSALVQAVSSLGDRAVGIFYWEPAWIAVPGDSWQARSALWEKHGSGWASSYAEAYDPQDAGKYYGGSACDNQALFDAFGRPLESLKTFLYLRTGEAA